MEVGSLSKVREGKVGMYLFLNQVRIDSKYLSM